MQSFLKLVSALGLVLTVFPAVLVFAGVIELQTHYILMTVGMLCWFGTAPFWMRPTTLEDESPS